jgi:hypothetical protein
MLLLDYARGPSTLVEDVKSCVEVISEFTSQIDSIAVDGEIIVAHLPMEEDITNSPADEPYFIAQA